MPYINNLVKIMITEKNWGLSNPPLKKFFGSSKNLDCKQKRVFAQSFSIPIRVSLPEPVGLHQLGLQQLGLLGLLGALM